jgi:hypothetical protein
VIRFSAALVVVAIGVLIAGVATSSLLLVYVAIGISAVALLVLGAGVALKRDELFRDDARPVSAVDGGTAGQQVGVDQQPANSEAGSGSWVPVSAAGETFGSPVFQGTSASRGNSGLGDDVWGSPASRDDRPARPVSGFPNRTSPGTPARPAAWPPPPKTSFPAVPAAEAATPPPAARGGTQRPSAPPTRADPVLPWADSLPTRANVARGKLADPVPSWLEDVDDVSAPAPSASSADAGLLKDRPSAATDDADGPDALTTGADAMDDAHVGARHATPADNEPDTWRMSPTDADDNDNDNESSATADDSWQPDPADGFGDDDLDADNVADTGAGTDDAHGDRTRADDADLGDAASSQAADDEAADASQADVGEGEQGDGERGDVRASSGAQHVTVVPGVPRYHDPNCILIRFMSDDDVQRLSVPEAEEAGCTPCRACQPE